VTYKVKKYIYILNDMKIRNKLSENMFCPTAGTFRNLVEVGGGGGGSVP